MVLQNEVYLAAESLHSKSKLCTEMSTYCGKGDVFHVEIVIKVDCFGAKNKCIYCERAKAFPKEHVNKKYGRHHFLSYSVYGGEKPYEHVYCAVDYDYERIQPSAWTFVSIPMSAPQRDAMRAFLEQCINDPFNTSFRARFLCLRMFPCVPWEVLGLFGMQRSMDGQGSYHKVAESSWYCSELCICALQEANWVPQLDSRIVPPNSLFNIISQTENTELVTALPVSANAIRIAAAKHAKAKSLQMKRVKSPNGTKSELAVVCTM